MSPSEDQLRSFMHDGEGDGLDVDAVIGHAQSHRAKVRQRQVRWAGAAAVALVVAGVGVGTGLALSGHTSHPSTRAEGNANNPKADARAAYGAGGGTSSGGLGCPAELPALATPRLGPGALFAAPSTQLEICAYPDGVGNAPSASAPPSTRLTGTAATAVINSLEHAPTTTPVRPCPLYRTANGKVLLITAIDATGAPMPPVEARVLQNLCGVVAVTNGTAVRYDWTPPAALAAFLATL